VNLSNAIDLVRHEGPAWVAYRLRRSVLHRLGWERLRMPAKPWSHWPLARLLRSEVPSEPQAYWEYRQQRCGGFFFVPSDRSNYSEILRAMDSQTGDPPSNWCQQRLEEIASGKIRFFQHHLWETGWPPQWHTNARDNKSAPSGIHFSQIGDFSVGDIKLIWELNRFAFTYDLARIYWRTDDENAPRLFWEAFEDWYKNNPPNLGVNWKCGQEIAFRLMAWCFALWAFWDSKHTTADRVAKLVQALGISAGRIETNIAYALSQNNNHAMTEAVGLCTVGLLFPEFKSSARWCRIGKSVLERTAERLVFDDGGFSQYSANYHRLMLHDYLWVLKLGEINGMIFPESLQQRIQKASDFSLALIDQSSGGVPRFGADDGSLVLPLNECDYWDFRPTAQLASWILNSRKPFSSGPWDEDLLWLSGQEALSAPQNVEKPADLEAEQAGIYALRSKHSHAVLRSGKYRFRPSDLDLLHVDLWWKGINVAIDPGTYSYNAEGSWGNNPLRATKYHNTVQLDLAKQPQIVGRFLVLPWPESEVEVLTHDPTGQLSTVEAVLNFPRSLHTRAKHRRVIMRVLDDNWLILDQVDLQPAGDAQLHWLLCDATYDFDYNERRLSLDLAPGPYHFRWGVLEGQSGDNELIRGDQSSPRGWRSPAYWSKVPALSLSQKAHGDRVCFYSWFSGHDSDIASEEGRVDISFCESVLRCELEGDSQKDLKLKVTLTGKEIGTTTHALGPIDK